MSRARKQLDKVAEDLGVRRPFDGAAQAAADSLTDAQLVALADSDAPPHVAGKARKGRWAKVTDDALARDVARIKKVGLRFHVLTDEELLADQDVLRESIRRKRERAAS